MKHSRNLSFANLYFSLFLFCFFSLQCSSIFASDRFVDNKDGTVSDTKNDLMWASKDNGFPISWPDSVEYCKNLETAGFNDWRIPSISELASLYDPAKQNANGYHIIHLITTTAQSCWASDTRGYTAIRFNFTYGKEFWLRKSYSGPTRVLPVRTYK